MLAHASSKIGRGKAFGLHEALDQFGALLGPLFVAAVLALTGSIRTPFALLAIPAGVVMLLLFRLRRAVPDPSLYDLTARVSEKKRLRLGSDLPRRFWLYALFSAATMFGFATWPLLAFHLAAHHVVGPAIIPLLYALSGGAAAISALLFGRLYDSVGLRGLLVLPFLSAAIPFLSFASTILAVTAGAILWGVVMGVHESTLSAAVADLVPAHRLGTGYGVFTSCYGLSWLGGAAIIGVLYEHGLHAVVAYVLAVQAVALLCCVPLFRSTRHPSSSKVV